MLRREFLGEWGETYQQVLNCVGMRGDDPDLYVGGKFGIIDIDVKLATPRHTDTIFYDETLNPMFACV